MKKSKDQMTLPLSSVPKRPDSEGNGLLINGSFPNNIRSIEEVRREKRNREDAGHFSEILQLISHLR
jgi:hypothetical protein